MPAVNFTDENFNDEVIKSSVPVLVDFWAPWCGPCKVQSPIIDELAAKYGPGQIKIGKLNVEENSEVASRFHVMSIPTLIIYKDGKPVAQMVGLQDNEILEEKINSII